MTKKTNPWIAKKTEKSSPELTGAATRRMSRSSTPKASSFLTELRQRSSTTTKSTSALSRLRASKQSAGSTGARGKGSALSACGLGLGDSVVCTWEYSRAYGDGHGRFQGEIIDIRDDEFFTLRDSTGVILDMWASMCKLEKIG